MTDYSIAMFGQSPMNFKCEHVKTESKIMSTALTKIDFPPNTEDLNCRFHSVRLEM